MQSNRKNNTSSIVTDALFGIIAGAVATFVMEKVSSFGYNLEDEQTRKYEENLRGNEYPPEVLAEKVAETVAGVELDKETRQKYGNDIHWGYGILSGGLFGVLRDRVPLSV